MDREINVAQINLQKSRAATSELVGQMLTNNISLALVQEPYVCKVANAYKIPGLNGIQCMARKESKFLSAILYNRDHIRPLFVPQLSTGNIVVISARIRTTQVFLVSVYLPPYSDLLAELPALQRILLVTAGHKTVIGGDFNVRSTLWFDHRDDNRAPTLEEFIATNNLAIINRPGTIPTFRSPNGCSYIDITLTTNSAIDDLSRWTVADDLVSSDHNAITFTVDTNPNRREVQAGAADFIVDCSHIMPGDIEEEMNEWSIDFECNHSNLNTPAQIDAAIDFLQGGIITRIISKGARRRKYRNRPEWWTDEVERFRKVYLRKKDLFYRNRHREYSNHLHSEMTAAKVKFVNKLQTTRKKAWDKFVENDLKVNPWGVVYKVAAGKFHEAGVLSCFTRDDDTITLTQEETMRHILHALLPDDDPEINNYTQRQEQRDYIGIVPRNTRGDRFQGEELDAIINALSTNKAPGVDGIKGNVVKLAHKWVGPSLLKIYNACWRLGYFPTAWKTGRLVILLKDPTQDFGNLKNYRPIVLLPAYGKILEKLIKHALAQAIIPMHAEAQFGFTPGRSTTDALWQYKDKIKGTTEKYAMTIFIDIRGAFDNVWWPGLLRNLRRREAPHELVVLIKSYLTDRKVLFTQDNITTQKVPTKGCPQGSVLGPTLWNLVLDPLLEADWPAGVSTIAYADDLAVVVTSNERQNMLERAQGALDKIAEWAKQNKLTISREKSVFMINKSPPRAHHRDIKLRVEGAQIKKVDGHKYLGVMVDPKLNFQANAAYTLKKAGRTTMGLRRMVWRNWGQETALALRAIYRGAILPILSYASRVWIDRLHTTKVHRKYQAAYGQVARLVTQSYASVSTEAAGVLAGLLPVDLELEKQNCVRELRKGRGALFHNELITPEMFDSVAHAAAYMSIKAEDVWQDRWNESVKGRTTFEFLPNVTTDWEQLPRVNFKRTQVLTGHGEFACHLLRIGKREDEECDACVGETDDPIHRILDCRKYLRAQEAINEELRTWPPSIRDIPFLENDEIFELLTSSEPSTDDI
jgi:hypothetical protein